MKIVIAGAGVIGSSIAWHLAVAGCREVVVVDRGPDFGAGSTSRATGGFRCQFGTAVNVRMSLLSREKLLRFEDEIGVDSGYRPHGYLFLVRKDSELAELQAAQRVQHACGSVAPRMIDRREVMEINPAIDDPDISGAAFCPCDGFIRPMEILRGYAEAARRLGVKFQFATEARILDPDVTYINACGAWAAELAPVPVVPLRRRIACTVPTTVLPETMPMTIWTGDGFHTRVRDARVMLLLPDHPPDDDTWLPQVTQLAHQRLPILREIPIDPAHCWEGLYEMSPDRHAIIGWHPTVPNLFLANGSSGHGVMHAPAIGQIVSEMVLSGRATCMDVHALRPSRFAEGLPVSGPALL